MGVASASTFAKWYTDVHGDTFDGNSLQWAFTSDSLRKSGTILESRGIRGTRTAAVEATRTGPYTVTGQLVADVTPLMLTWWLPYILGASESSDTFATAETLPEFDIICDRVGGVFKYSGCRVNRAAFRGQKGQLVTLTMDIVGETEETGVSTAFASGVSLGTAAGDYPYAFTDSALSLYSGSRSINDFELVIDNALVPNGYNTLTAQDITTTDRIVTAGTSTRFTSSEMAALYDQGTAGAAATLTLTNNNMSTVASLGRLQIPPQSPIIEQNPEITLPLLGVVRGIAGAAEISFTNDDNDAS